LTENTIEGNRKIVSKIASVEDLIFDTCMFVNYEYDKVIPDFKEFNKLFMKDSVEGNGVWKPFNITNDEYEELVESLTFLYSPILNYQEQFCLCIHLYID
jgi:hypothetical protein